MFDDFTPGQQAAAFHGLAINPSVPLADRLKLALQALDILVAEAEKRDAVVEAAEEWREMRRGAPTKPKPESAALIAAVDAWKASPDGR